MTISTRGEIACRAANPPQGQESEGVVLISQALGRWSRSRLYRVCYPEEVAGDDMECLEYWMTFDVPVPAGHPAWREIVHALFASRCAAARVLVGPDAVESKIARAKGLRSTLRRIIL